jgi:Tfp pilus assembly protein FimT
MGGRRAWQSIAGGRGDAPSPASGVTLLELVIVATVLVLIGGAAISLLSSGQREAVAQEAARQIAADIAYAQADALAHGAARLVVFDAQTEHYGLYDGSGAEPLPHPVSQRPHEVDLSALFAGTAVDLGAADFDGSDTLRFGAGGRPAAGGTIEIHAAGSSWTIRIAAGSGRVTLVPSGKDGLPEKDPEPPVPDL